MGEKGSVAAHIKKDLKSKVDSNFDFVPSCSSSTDAKIKWRGAKEKHGQGMLWWGKHKIRGTVKSSENQRVEEKLLQLCILKKKVGQSGIQSNSSWKLLL